MIPFCNSQDHDSTQEVYSGLFNYHQDDQEGQECPPSGDLWGFGCINGYFVTVIAHCALFKAQ